MRNFILRSLLYVMIIAVCYGIIIGLAFYFDPQLGYPISYSIIVRPFNILIVVFYLLFTILNNKNSIICILTAVVLCIVVFLWDSFKYENTYKYILAVLDTILVGFGYFISRHKA